MTVSRPTAPDAAADEETLAELEALAVDFAEAAARLIRDERPGDLGAQSKTSRTDVVTVMDTRSEEFLRDRILTARPRDGLLGEEGSASPSQTGLTWVIDPIDGTTNYLYGMPLYAVSVAVVVGNPSEPGWRPVVGAVCSPGMGVTWSARTRGGARSAAIGGGTPREVAVGGATELAQGLVGTGFGYQAAVRAEQAAVLTTVLPRVRDIRRLGSAAVDLCLVGDGRLDAYYESGLKPWDLAAGWLIVTEAGGVVSGPGGADPDVTLTVAGNRMVHDQLRELVDP